MKENLTLVRQIIAKLQEVGWAVDMSRDSSGYWVCRTWRKDEPEKGGSAAGTTRLSAIHACILEVISKI